MGISRRQLLAGSTGTLIAATGCAGEPTKDTGDPEYFLKKGNLHKALKRITKKARSQLVRNIAVSPHQLEVQYAEVRYLCAGSSRIWVQPERPLLESPDMAVNELYLPELPQILDQARQVNPGQLLVEPYAAVSRNQTWGMPMTNVNSESTAFSVALDDQMRPVPRVDLTSREGFLQAFGEVRDLTRIQQVSRISLNERQLSVRAPNEERVSGVPERDAATMFVNRPPQRRVSNAPTDPGPTEDTFALGAVIPNFLMDAIERLGTPTWQADISLDSEQAPYYLAYDNKKAIRLNSQGQLTP